MHGIVELKIHGKNITSLGAQDFCTTPTAITNKTKTSTVAGQVARS